MSRTPIGRPPAKPKAPPPRPAVNRKGAPPGPTETLGALKAAAPKKTAKPAATVKTKAKAKPAPAKAPSERVKALNFTVTANFRKAFKLAAEARDCKKVELLEMIFEEWQNRHPV